MSHAGMGTTKSWLDHHKKIRAGRPLGFYLNVFHKVYGILFSKCNLLPASTKHFRIVE